MEMRPVVMVAVEFHLRRRRQSGRHKNRTRRVRRIYANLKTRRALVRARIGRHRETRARADLLRIEQSNAHLSLLCDRRDGLPPACSRQRDFSSLVDAKTVDRTASPIPG